MVSSEAMPPIASRTASSVRAASAAVTAGATSSSGGGGRRGLPPPALPGVNSVTEQVAIARQKGGIGPKEPVKLYRFEVVRHH